MPIPSGALESEPSSAYVLDREGRIIQVNSAWDRLAGEAGGPTSSEVLRTRWIDHIRGEEPRAFYADLLARLMRGGAGERHCCACNTPSRYRVFSDRFDPIRGPDWTAIAVVVVTSEIENHLVEERYVVAPPDLARHLQPSGVLLECSGCRRVHVAGTTPRVWEFVPEYVKERPAEVSHGICELCREIYYGFRKHRDM